MNEQAIEAGRGVQEVLAPEATCWGCGPANPDGLHLRSFERGDELIAEWRPGPNHHAFPNVLNGGIIGTLLDCHSNWTAALHFMRTRGLDGPPVTVTAEYTIRLLKPTPTGAPVKMRAWVEEAGERKVIVKAELSSGGVVTATCSGVFVLTGETHPAYGGW